MKTCLWHWSVGSIFGGVAATVLFAVVWAARHGGDFSTLWADPEPLLIAAVLSALVSGFAALIISRLSRRPIVQIVKPIAAPLAPPAVAPPAVASQVQIAKPKRRQAPFLSRLMAGRITPQLHWDRLSRSLQKLLGVSAKRLRGKSMLERIHAEDRTVIERRFQNPSKIAFDARFRLLPPKKKLPSGKPGELIYVQLTAAPLRDEQNKLVAWRCLFVDVTRQVLAEETRQTQLAALGQAQYKWQRIQRQLDRLKDSYSDLYHNAPVLYFSLDAAGKFVTFNDTLLRTLGYQREELLNRSYTDVAVKREQGPPEFDVPTNKEHEWETQWRRRDGSLIDVWLRTIAVFDEKGTFARWRSSALDYTERNRLAKELRTHTEELQHTNSRLRHINSELEDFTHVVSHDLKEPLRTLQAFSHLLAEDFSSQLSTDGFQYVNHLLQASRRLGHLIDDLLNLSQAGRTARAPQPFNLIETVATVRRDLVDLIQRKEATILTEGTLPTVVGDPQRITQLLTNLVANGLKYNKHPEPRVTIGQKEGTDDQVMIYVRDNGIGIESEHHQQIFGLFRRVNHQDEYEGTGAGLAICKKIVEAHGGRIWVESAAGQGATFYFTLPTKSSPAPAATRNGRHDKSPSLVKPAPVSPAAPVRSKRVMSKTATSEGREGVHILLVEDSPEMGALIERLGERSGLQVTWLKTAEEAWDWLQDGRPDFLLLDVNLPGMSGRELCRRVRMVRQSEVPITLISQNEEHSDQLREIGANHFMSKELLVEPAVWQQRLQEILDVSLKAATVSY